MSSSAASAVPASPAAPAASTIIDLGMDVHKDSFTVAVLPEGAPAPTRLDRLPNDLPTLFRQARQCRLGARGVAGPQPRVGEVEEQGGVRRNKRVDTLQIADVSG